MKLMPIYQSPNPRLTILPNEDQALVDFFTEFGSDSRYFNLNEVCEAKMDHSPLDKWLDLARSIYEECTPYQVRQKASMSLMYRMDREGPPNSFTSHLDLYGHPMMVFDCLHRQLVIQKSAPLVIWRLIELLQPIYFLLEAMAHKASNYETANGIYSMIIPHYEDFFPFLLADKSTIKRRKNWLETFNR